MSTFVLVVRGIAAAVLYFLDFAMLARALLSWAPFDEENRLVGLLYMITEPFIFPVRSLLERFEFFRSFPLDLSFTITSMLLVTMTMFI